MDDLAAMLQSQAHNVWLFIPSAILLGALHGLEPGHSKTMMAAFIVAVRGTVGQAVMLGLAATVSHTAVVWIVALAGLHFGTRWGGASEPWFHLASGALVLVIGAWMLWRTRFATRHAHSHDHNDHAHEDGHSHHDRFAQTRYRPTGVEAVARHERFSTFDHDPHDAHAAAHARDIRRRFTEREVSTGQILLFGLTGGLIPCPASITVLLLCLQLRQFSLGMTLVLSFSVGLALTLVASGMVAALGVRQLRRHGDGLARIAERAPYLSGTLVALVGAYMGWQGLSVLV
jgi:ABC-type nickel/cobalt efflux system permease component RcnA